MESPKPPMPEISDSERSPLVDALFEVIAWQQKRIEELEQQILKLKGETRKPSVVVDEVAHRRGEGAPPTVLLMDGQKSLWEAAQAHRGSASSNDNLAA